ncbi:MAG: right-handed parallel beta-helix repeat-containing protein [Gammaproteobacteria bacterium]|nr:right-handed parallel beta-helix repeat-containing protein [Gammaproteobacteria bacterium]
MRLVKCLVVLFLLILSNLARSETIVIHGRVFIDKPTTYNNVTLDLSHGSFVITNGAVLHVENSIIQGTLSSNNPFLIYGLAGRLEFINNRVHVAVDGVSPQPDIPAQYNAFRTRQAEVIFSGNTFFVGTPFAVGLFATDKLATSKIKIINNSIQNFHGGILLSHSQNAQIIHNQFYKVSSGNIFIVNNQHAIVNHNTILFPGNGHVGDGVDIVNSNDVVLASNYIFSGSCYGVLILASSHISIQHNNISSGITYGIHINTAMENLEYPYAYLKRAIENENFVSIDNNHIIIQNNYIAQNRYGLSASYVDDLIVTNNLFIQSFSDRFQRKFWTNNNTLLKNITHLTWLHNTYKEAFTQYVKGDNANALKYFDFPRNGGVNF